MDTREWMTPAEVAEALDVCRRTVYRMMRRGEIRAFRLGGRWRIQRSSLEALLRRAA